MATADLIIRIITDTSQAKGLDETPGRLGKVGGALNKMAVPAAAALAGVVAFGTGAAKAASNLQQSMGAVEAVFGKNADQVKAWADQSATAVGLSKNAYMEMASIMGAQLKNMGLPMSQVTDKTNDLIKMGADLSAQYGGSTKDAVEALGAALRGETDPIERYGISIKQADIAAQQAKEGTDKLTGAAGKQAKTMALLHLLNKQSADATGAFNREQDTAAHQAQVAAAEYENMQAALGAALLPAITMVSAALGDLAKWVAKNKTAAQILIGAIAAVAATILILVAALKTYKVIMEVIQIVQKATWLSNPIFLVIAAVILLVAGFVILYKRSKTFRDFINGMWAGITAAAKAAWRIIKGAAVGTFNWIKGHWKLLLAILGGPVVAAAIVIISNWRKIRETAARVITWLKTAWRAMVTVLKTVWTGAVTFIKSKFDGVKDKARAIFDSVKTFAKNAVTAVKDKFGEITAKLKDIIPPGLAVTLKAPFTAMGKAVDAVSKAIDTLIGWIKNIPVPKINWPSPPKWVDKIMPGMMPLPPGTGAPAVPAAVGRSLAPGVAARGATHPQMGGGGVNVFVYGAMDPEGVARQIQRILTNHDRRVGLRTA